MWSRSTATSSPSRSTGRGRSAWWIVLWTGCENPRRETVWVFGYGSLIWDGWQNKGGRRCLRSAWAELHGYRRIFNKRSVRNWGTRAMPCPTLNLEEANLACCRGMAFEFAHDAWFISEMLLYLQRREGCDPRELPI